MSALTCRLLVLSGLLVSTIVLTEACTSKPAGQSTVDTNTAESTHGVATVAANAASNAQEALTALENAWPKAVAERDTAMFEKTLAPGFVYTEDSAIMSRADVIKGMTSGPDTVQSGNNEDMVVHDFGNSTAVVTGILVLRGRGHTGPFTRRYRFTDTWTYRDGKWQIVAAQDYLIPK